jgi:colanic acid biosynthesis glycosyl transferase WcaI
MEPLYHRQMSKSSLRAPAYTFTRTQVVAATLALAAIAFFFRDSLQFLYASWQRDEYSHCALIPLLSGFLLWQRWPEIRRRHFEMMPAGLLAVLVGLLLWLLSSLATSAVVAAYALVTVFAGVLLTLMGWNAFKRALGPIALLVLMIPLPDSVHVLVSSTLHNWALGLGVGIMRLFNVSVLLEGGVLDVGVRQLNMGESAGGLAILLPLLSLATIMAFFVESRLWVRIAIVASAIPIAILMNGVRVALIGLQLSQSGTTAQLLHLLEGWAIFMVCVVILTAELWLLLILSGDRRRLREALTVDWSRSAAVPGDLPLQNVRMLVIASNFAPEITGIGKYVGEMTAWLAKAGYEIRVVTAPPYYPAWRVAAGYSSRRYSLERHSGALVYRCPLLVPRKPGGLTRLLHMLSFGISTLPIILWQAIAWRPQVVFVVQPPLVCAPAALLGARLCGAQAWLHVQDFEVDAAFDLGLLRSDILRRIAFGVERWLMRHFDKVSSISDAMLKKLGDKGVPSWRIGFFPNWVDTRLIHPLAGDNQLRAELGIDPATTVLLYSGNMGEKQGLGLLVDVAQTFVDAPDILFLLCGDGAAKRRMMTAAAGLANVRFMPLQPLERLNELLNLADVHLLPQRAEAEDLVMPSKLTAIMSCGRPVVAAARPGSVVERAASKGGLVVTPGDAVAFGAAIRSLLSDAALRTRLGMAGRLYAESHWDREPVLKAMLVELEESMVDFAPSQPIMARSATQE